MDEPKTISFSITYSTLWVRMKGEKRNNRNTDETLNIPPKANRILNIILVAMVLIILRIWHLAVIQHNEKVDESRRPQRHHITETANRATIRDRFNIPLAINKVQYNLAILYSQIKQIPTVAWDVDDEGKRVKRFQRKEHIAELSKLLSKELKMDADRIEDLIYAKAAMYDQIPFLLKEDISEQEYYRLKMLERDWHGIHVQRVPRRDYPLGKVASDILGYMGAINKQEYEEIIREMRSLESDIESSEAYEMPNFSGEITSIDQARQRLKELHELAYTINDSIGKAGIEGRFEKTLRGFRGRKSYYSDAKGNILHELPGAHEALSGKRMLLTISSELQEFSENLLIQNEKIRLTRLSHLDAIKHTILADKEPWIKGGAIVAIDPNNGEIIAMVSHPRYDPNDFIARGEHAESKQHRLQKWLESERYLAGLWNQQYVMEREGIDNKTHEHFIEEMPITWDNYIGLVLSYDSDVKRVLYAHHTVNDAVFIQRYTEHLTNLAPQISVYPLFNILYQEEDNHEPHGKKIARAKAEEIQKTLSPFHQLIQEHKNALAPYFGTLARTYDKILLVDLMRVAVDSERFNDDLLKAVGSQSLSTYKENSTALFKLNEIVRKMTKELFHEIDFKPWRKINEKEYLKSIRAAEKAAHTYAKPYIDYLDQLENEQFQSFWDSNRWELFSAFLLGITKTSTNSPYIEHFLDWHREIATGAHQHTDWINSYQTLQHSIKPLQVTLAIQYLQSMRNFSDLNRPLLGTYRYLRKGKNQIQLEKHLACAFYPQYGYGYGRSQAYRQSATQGSLFKLITAYEALVQKYHSLENSGKSLDDLNPLLMTDSVYYKGKELYLGYDSDNKPLPRFYKGGRLPRSVMTNIGTTDILKAIETSSNPYFALLAGDVLHSPNDLANAAKLFSYGHRTGIDLPYEIPGKVPDDLEVNRTGLYAFSIGQHTLVVTPLQTSIMLSTIANGGKVLKPKIVRVLAGKEPKYGQDLIGGSHYFPYEKELETVGIDFPLFVATDSKEQKTLITYVPSEIKNEIFLPNAIQHILLDGMCRVVTRTHGESLRALSKLYSKAPEAIKDYILFKQQLLGKTSTSESVENIDLDLGTGTNMYTHVWFGGIVYDRDVIDQKQHRFLFRNTMGDPELVVVVYLRYGGYGKEAGPIAAQVAKKWREIKARHKQ